MHISDEMVSAAWDKITECSGTWFPSKHQVRSILSAALDQIQITSVGFLHRNGKTSIVCKFPLDEVAAEYGWTKQPIYTISFRPSPTRTEDKG